MRVIEVGDVQAGDNLRWEFPSGPTNHGRVSQIVGWGHSVNYNAPYVEFFSDHIRRAIALPFITHHNGRRVDRKYWAGRLPELDLLNSNGSVNETRSFGVQQLQWPMNKEDALALKTSTRKGLDEMSESHRTHIEKWEPHIEALGAEHVWASANRFSERGGAGPVYVAVKRGSKDYAIVDYNTDTQKKAKVLEDGFESSKALMEAFKQYRGLAKEERATDREERKAAKKATKPAPKGQAKPAKKTPAKKPVRKKS